MSLHNSAQPAGQASFVATLGAYAVRIWRDPGFQAVLREEAWRFVVSVSAEARAAAQR